MFSQVTCRFFRACYAILGRASPHIRFEKTKVNLSADKLRFALFALQQIRKFCMRNKYICHEENGSEYSKTNMIRS
jgi:hypothetical protein